MTIMYNDMAGYHKPIKLATYCNHKIICNINILTKKHQKDHKNNQGRCMCISINVTYRILTTKWILYLYLITLFNEHNKLK